MNDRTADALCGPSGADDGERADVWVGAKVARTLVLAPIRLYQVTLSRVTPPMCRFTPSCSEYAVQAVRVHGVLRGLALGCWRIARCNPFGAGGYDPVPPARAKHARSRENTDG